MPEVPQQVQVAEEAEPPRIGVVSLTTREEMEAYIRKEYPVRAREIIDTIACESSFNPNAVGDSGQSYGLAQVHRPSHPQYAVETLTDPKWAIDFMGESFNKGQERMWTCWRKLYGTK